MARKKVQENHLADMAMKAEMDHEVQMARSDLYKIAKYAVELHDMLKNKSEAEGLQGWQQSKITKAADYLGAVYHDMDYDVNIEMAEGKKKPDGDGDGVPPWADKDDDDPDVQEAKDQNNDGKNDFTDVKIARMKASGMPTKVAIAKATKKNASEAMLKNIKKAILFKEGKIGRANISPKVFKLAEMSKRQLIKLSENFEKKLQLQKKIFESMYDNKNAFLTATQMDPNSPQWQNLPDDQKVKLHQAAQPLVTRYGAGGIPEAELQKLQQMVPQSVNEGEYGEITHTDEDPTMSEVLVKGMGVYRIDQLEQRIKERIGNIGQLLDRGEADQAARLLDPNSSTYKSLMVMMKALAEAHDDLAFGDNFGNAPMNEAEEVCEKCGNPSWRKFKEKDAELQEDNSICWRGYERVPGTEAYSKGSCQKKKQ